MFSLHGELAAQLVADGPLVAMLPDAADGDLVAEAGVAVGERVRGQVVGGELRGPGIRRRRTVPVGVVDRAVLGQQLGGAVARVVGVREPEIDQERVGVLRRLPLPEVFHHPVAMPGAAGLGRAATLGGVMPDLEELVGGLVAVADLAGAHGVVAGRG